MKPLPLQAPGKHRRAPRETLRQSKKGIPKSTLAEAGGQPVSHTAGIPGSQPALGQARGPQPHQLTEQWQDLWALGRGSGCLCHQLPTSAGPSHFLSHALTVWSGRRAKGLRLLLPTGLERSRSQGSLPAPSWTKQPTTSRCRRTSHPIPSACRAVPRPRAAGLTRAFPLSDPAGPLSSLSRLPPEGLREVHS